MTVDGINWIQIEPTRICNMRCSYCDRTISGTNGMSMSRDTFQKILDGIKYLSDLKSVLIQGFGEPLMYNDLDYMVETLRKEVPFLSIQTVTNGMVMDERVQRLIKHIDVLYCSVDSMDASYWKEVRKGGNLTIIKANLEAMLLLNPSLSIVLNAVVSERNINGLFEVCEFAEAVNCAGVQLIPVYEFEEGTSKDDAAKNFSFMKERLKELRESFSLEIYGPYDVNSGDKCFWVERGVYILYDGQVTPCCVMSSDDQIIYGDLKKDSLKDILISNSRKNFQKNVGCNERCIECKSLFFNRIWNSQKELPLLSG